MKKLLWGMAVISLCCAGYFFLYQKAATELRLAELKSDIDGMYSPLERLAFLQVPSAQRRLDLVSRAIVVREEMLRASADHDHERAVTAAGELLDIFPQHTDGIRTLRESGQILYLLRESLVLASNSLGTEKPSSTTYETVAFENPDIPNETNFALLTYIQNGLSELGYYSSPVDGMAGSATVKALENFRDATGISSELTISDVSANQIAKALSLNKAVKHWRERKYFDINRAIDLAQKAVQLDPQFEQARSLAADLDQAHEAMALLLSESVISQEQWILAQAASTHDIAASALANAASSRYRSVSDTYKQLEPNLNEIRRLLESMQVGVDESMQLISTYKGQRSREYFNDLKEFTQIVRLSIDSLLVPTGTLVQFRQAGSDAVQDFKRVKSRLETSIPNSAQVEETVTGFMKAFSEYRLFDNSSTEAIIEAHSELYSI